MDLYTLNNYSIYLWLNVIKFKRVLNSIYCLQKTKNNFKRVSGFQIQNDAMAEIFIKHVSNIQNPWQDRRIILYIGVAQCSFTTCKCFPVNTALKTCCSGFLW